MELEETEIGETLSKRREFYYIRSGKRL